MFLYLSNVKENNLCFRVIYVRVFKKITYNLTLTGIKELVFIICVKLDRAILVAGLKMPL